MRGEEGQRTEKWWCKLLLAIQSEHFVVADPNNSEKNSIYIGSRKTGGSE